MGTQQKPQAIASAIEGIASIRTMLEQNDDLAAETALLKFVEYQPKHLEALLLLGKLYSKHQHTNLAIDYLNQALVIDNQQEEVQIELAQCNIQLGNIEQAIKFARTATEIVPQSSPAFCILGSAYQSSDTNIAIDYLNKAIELDASNDIALNQLGIIYYEQQAIEQALPYFQISCAVSAKSDYHCNLAYCHLQLSQMEEAWINFKKSNELDNTNPKALFGLAGIYHTLKKFDLAEKFSLETLKIVPTNNDALHLLGWIYINTNRTTEAHTCFNSMIEINAEDHRAFIGRGTLFMECGETDKAETAFKQAIHLNPKDIASRCSLTQLNKTKDGDSNMAELVALLETASLNSTETIQTHYALGKCNNDLGKFKNAFYHYDLGAKLKRSTIKYNIDYELELAEKIQQFFCSNKIDELKQYSHSSNRPIFIIGMPRSGTTLTEQIISNHTEVYGAGEIDYLSRAAQANTPNKHSFLNNLSTISGDNFRNIALGYLEQLGKLSDKPRITDKMPANFYYLGLIHSLLPNAKIIHVQRNPVDTCWSCYTQLFDHSLPQTYDFSEIAQYYQLYNQLMNHWRAILPSNAFLDITYEDIVNKKDQSIRQLTEYCQLDWHQQLTNNQDNKRAVHTASVLQVRQPIYTTSIDRWKNYQPDINPLVDALGDIHPQETTKE